MKCICLKRFGFHKIFQPVYPELNGTVPFEEIPLWLKYLAILGFWLFGFGVIEFYIIFFFIDQDKIDLTDDSFKCFFVFLAIIISIALFLCFQIFLTALITPFILICFISHHFFEMLLYFFGIGYP